LEGHLIPILVASQPDTASDEAETWLNTVQAKMQDVLQTAPREEAQMKLLVLMQTLHDYVKQAAQSRKQAAADNFVSLNFVSLPEPGDESGWRLLLERCALPPPEGRRLEQRQVMEAWARDISRGLPTHCRPKSPADFKEPPVVQGVDVVF
jgi:hypothetical protein